MILMCVFVCEFVYTTATYLFVSLLTLVPGNLIKTLRRKTNDESRKEKKRKKVIESEQKKESERWKGEGGKGQSKTKTNT